MESLYFKIVSIYICILIITAQLGAAPQQGGFGHGSLADSAGSMATPAASASAISLSGRVVLDDGAAPSERVLIELVCNDNPYPEGYTDSKGRFSVQLGQDQSMLPSANAELSKGFNGAPIGSQAGPVHEMDLRNCDLRAALPGFRSDTVYLNNHRALDNPEVGMIVLHRLANVEGFTISATSVLAPPDARKAFEKGLADLKKKKPEQARKDFGKATGIYPKYAPAWFELGMIYEQSNHADQARAAYASASAADSKYINPYLRLCVIAYQEQKWQDLADSSSHVVRLNPYDFPAARYLNAVANLELNNLDAAEKSAREVIRRDSAHRQPKARYLLGLILVRERRFAEAAECVRIYLAGVSDAGQQEMLRKQLAEIEEFAQAAARSAVQASEAHSQ